MIKVRDVAFVRFGAPDLDAMERFSTDFGFATAERRGETLYVRGTDPAPYVHVSERGEPGFRGIAFEAGSAGDLQALAQMEGSSPVEALDGPGGGARVRMTDPDGFCVEVVYGREPSAPLPISKASPLNRGSERLRFGELQRLERGPAQVKRVGHFVLRISDFRLSEPWYKQRLGLLDSDRFFLGDPENVMGAFMRCDGGDAYVDHHTVALVQLDGPKFDHAAFEVEDFDALMLGHDHLSQSGYEHQAGIGRHVLGSQIFDYWRDPWGHVLEHFTDGDLLDAGTAPNLVDPATVLGTQWGRFAP
jgi:hypothetical protein